MFTYVATPIGIFISDVFPNQHLVASREHGADPVTFTSAAFNQLKFNQLDPEVFPLPKFSLEQKDTSCESDLIFPCLTLMLPLTNSNLWITPQGVSVAGQRPRENPTSTASHPRKGS